MSKKIKHKNGLEFYQCTTKGKREWRWRIYRQGRKISAATEGYRNLIDAQANVKSTHEMTKPTQWK